jgi:hypothetical protein
MIVKSATIRAVAFVMLTGVLAVTIIATMLLLGVNPHRVFLPGFLVRSWCERLGFHVPNRVGVLSTVVLYWGAIIAIRFIVANASQRRRPTGR